MGYSKNHRFLKSKKIYPSPNNAHKIMNKYKIVSLVLGIALLATMTRLVAIHRDATTNEPNSVSSTAHAVMSNILSRKSVRSYTHEAVTRSQLDTLVRVAMAAPTGRDMRPWKFIVIDDKAMMQKLANTLPYAKMLTEAQAAIVVCGDLSITDKEGKPSTNWAFDCSAATENLLLQAEAMGLGAVWTGVYPYEDRTAAVQSVISLPQNIVPFCLVPIGHPKGEPQPKDKYNKENIHYNGW